MAKWIVATIALVGLLACVLQWSAGDESHARASGPLAPQQDRAYSTAVGEQRTEPLPGGGSVVLNTASEMRLYDTPDQTDVSLPTGEALFDNTNADSRPLRVMTDGADLSAVHARFSVRTDAEGRFRAHVFSGAVTTSPHASRGKARTRAFSSFQLVAGMSAAAAQNRITISKFSVEDGNRYLAWTKGMVEVDGEPLGLAILDMNRYNRAQIEIADESIAPLLISGTFKATEPLQFALQLQKIYKLAVLFKSDSTDSISIILSRHPSEEGANKGSKKRTRFDIVGRSAPAAAPT